MHHIIRKIKIDNKTFKIAISKDMHKTLRYLNKKTKQKLYKKVLKEHLKNKKTLPGKKLPKIQTIKNIFKKLEYANILYHNPKYIQKIIKHLNHKDEIIRENLVSILKNIELTSIKPRYIKPIIPALFSALKSNNKYINKTISHILKQIHKNKPSLIKQYKNIDFKE